MKQYSYGLCSLLKLCVKSPVVTLTIAARQYPTMQWMKWENLLMNTF